MLFGFSANVWDSNKTLQTLELYQLTSRLCEMTIICFGIYWCRLDVFGILAFLAENNV